MINIPTDKLSNVLNALASAGLLITDRHITFATHNKLYRIGTEQRPKSKDGWFKVLYDGQLEFITICYGNWFTQLSDKCHINLKDRESFVKRTYEEHSILQKQVNARIEADRIKQLQEIEQKRIYYVDIYNKLNGCQNHEYLTRKGIQYPQHYQLKIDNRFNRNLLCVPFINSNGVLQGYQSIGIDGTKRFNGSIGGYYWQYPISRSCTEIFNNSNTFFILCEGLATGLSVYEALISYFDKEIYLPVVLCAFNVGNLEKVISVTKHQKLPYLYLIDNDSTKSHNAGIETAKKVVVNHLDCQIYPLTFNNGDANDFIVKYGVKEFIQLLNKYAKPIINKILNNKGL